MRFATLALLGASVVAAQNAPKAAYIYPAGARVGETVEVRVGGQFLSGASKAYVSGEVVSAKVVRYGRPVSGADVSGTSGEGARWPFRSSTLEASEFNS